MEHVLGFQEPLLDDVVEEKSYGLKLVPWISWDEWKLVKQNLFSSSPDCVTSALQRISTWRSRGCCPVSVDVTASIVEIQQKDPYFRNDMNESAWQSEEMLAMVYCMAIMRLVNGVVEKTRKKNEVSIGEAADGVGIPRMLIDIRHEGSHRDLPSLQLVRFASKKALDWLISYYWEPQEKAIPVQDNQTANLREEIKLRLHEVDLCLKAKRSKPSLSHPKTKRIKQTEHLFGRNKFLLPMAAKLPGYKKQLNKSLRNVLRLYYSFSPEVVYVLLEFLLNASYSANLTEHLDNSQIGQSTEKNQTAYEDWKSVVLKLSRKEPEFLLSLTQAVLEKMETKKGIQGEIDDPLSPKNSTEHQQIELLSLLFEWLARNLKPFNLASQKEPAENKEKPLSKETLMGLLRKCLLLSSAGNKPLMASALTLAHLTGDTSLLQKLKKLSLLELSNTKSNLDDSCNETLLSHQESSIHKAEEKLEFIRLCRVQGKKGKPQDSEMGCKSRWCVAKSWNPCPIGMLPSTVGFSGRLPVLDFPDECREFVKSSDNKEGCELGNRRKRVAENSIEDLDTSSEGVRDNEEGCEPGNRRKRVAENSIEDLNTSSEGVRGHLMINGVLTPVRENDFLAIASAVRLLC